MRFERTEEFRCEECNSDLTDKKHIRIFLGFKSGWMLPPFIGGIPVASIADRNPESHFCKPEHLASFFAKKLYAVLPNAAENSSRIELESASETLLAEASVERSRVPRTADVGARNHTQRTPGERTVVAGTVVRIQSLGGSVSGRGDSEQTNQSVDSVQSDSELGRSVERVLSDDMAEGLPILKWFVRSGSMAKKALVGVLP